MEVQQQMLGGRYTLLNELGRGGMAVVWNARDEVLGRSVAVKVLAGRYAGDAQSRARILEEARHTATLSHPNIAQVYDYGESDEQGRVVPYVVMELVHGITLQQRMRSGLIPPEQIFRICGQVAAALAAAHADGLVHRDIKPANVMVTQEGAKVVDFGLAAVAGPADPGAALFGTPAYLAPERLTGGPVVPATDVYALGVLMFRLLAGESPWTVDSTTQMISAHVYVEPAPLPRLAEVPQQVADLVDQCLKKDPGERPSAGQVAATLARAILLKPPAPPPVEVVPTPRRWRRLLLGGVAAAAVAAVALWFLLPEGADDGGEVLPAASPLIPGQSVIGAAPSGPVATPTRSAAAAPGGALDVPSGTPTEVVPPPPPPPAATGEPSVPATTRPTPTAEPTTTEPIADVRTFTSRGGTIDARCTDAGRAELVAWTPTEPYAVQRVNKGPAVAAVIVFRDGTSRIRMTVTCVAGTPTVVTLPL